MSNNQSEILEKYAEEQVKNKSYLEAIKSYKHLLNYKPDNCNFYLKISECLKAINEYDLAIGFLQEAININPEYADAYLSLGEIYSKNLNNKEEAIKHYKQYLKLNPNNASICNAIGNLYKEIDKYKNTEEQIKYFKKAVELKPDFKGALRNLAIVYSINEGLEKEAIECFCKLFELGAIYDDNFAYACLKIKLKDFEEGWKHYESRFQKFFEPSSYIKTSKPEWSGQVLKNETLLINYEQGFGDSICFVRYLEHIKPLVKNIILRVQDSLADLFKLNFHGIKIVGQVPPEDISFDFHIPLLSIMNVLHETVENIPLAQGYIKADKRRQEQYKKKFFDNDCFKIGIAWKGSKYGNKMRDIPLEVFYPLTKIKNVKVYSFQKGSNLEQLDNISKGIEIIDIAKTFNDFNDTAAAMANLDLFVSSDNGVFNLAAAIGIKTCLMLNKPSEWRWFLDEKSTPWYNSVQIFKKQTPEESWQSLLQKIVLNISDTKYFSN